MLRQQRGHVYVDDEHFAPGDVPGLFFSGAGHVLDLRPPRPRPASRIGWAKATWRRPLPRSKPALRTDALGQDVQAAWQQLTAWFGPYVSSPRAEIWPLAEGGRVDLWARFGARDVLLRFELDAEQQIRFLLLGPRATWWASVAAGAPSDPKRSEDAPGQD